MTRISLILVCLVAACATPQSPTPRFVNAPAVTVIDDRIDTPVAPAPREFASLLYHLRGNIVRRVTRALEVRRDQRALGVNALDEVPDSTWFTNRIGVRELSLDELRNGPAVAGSPELHTPWTISSTKVGGRSAGFIIKDARGEKYVLKFDEKGFPETETATDAITSRLLWAVGYNVPEDHVVYFRTSDLVIAPNAKVKDVFGNARPLRAEDLAQIMSTIESEPDGRIRGLASRLLDGTWLGGHPVEGVRADDPNDRIPHELRRDLRGGLPIFAWLDHVDVKEDNFLDMWVADPANPARHYVKHYLIDFGKALGAMAEIERDPRRGYTYGLDFAHMIGSLASAGLDERQWENRTTPGLRGVGMFESRRYDPGNWKPYNPSYLPFRLADEVDSFWGAKLLIRFTREQLRAVVDTGRLSDPRAADYITDTLVARQRATALYWFARISPLDGFTLRDDRLCFDDLLLTHRLSPVGAVTRYTISVTNQQGRNLPQPGATELVPSADGHACTTPLELAADDDGYSIIRIRMSRFGRDVSTYVHVARSQGVRRVIGIWRQ